MNFAGAQRELEDVSLWPISAAKAVVMGVDVAFSSTGDYAAICVAGLWAQGARSLIGVVEITQVPRGTSADNLADLISQTAMKYPRSPKIIVDVSNNQSFLSILAARFTKPANYLLGAQITNAHDHNSQPTATEVTLLGQRAVVQKISLSKRCLVEDLSAELDAKTTRLARVGDWMELKNELMSMERIVKPASVTYSAPAGRHDDLVTALCLSVYGLRKFGAQKSNVRRRPAPQFSAKAWT